MDNEKLLRVKEVMDIFKLSRSTIYRMIVNGDLDVVRIGRSVRIKESGIRKYFNEVSDVKDRQ